MSTNSLSKKLLSSPFLQGSALTTSGLSLILEQGLLAVIAPLWASVGLSLMNHKQLQQKAEEKVEGEVVELQTTEQKSLIAELEAVKKELTFLEENYLNSQSQITDVNPEESSTKANRVGIFIDHANLECAAQALNFSVDYQALPHILKGDGSLMGTWLYGASRRNYNRQKSFYNFLRNNEYTVFTKEVVDRADGSSKANVDIELALDAHRLADNFDTLVLISGDGDFVRLVEELKQKGKKVEVVSHSSHTSYKLRKIADRFIPLATIQNQISRDSN